MFDTEVSKKIKTIKTIKIDVRAASKMTRAQLENIKAESAAAADNAKNEKDKAEENVYRANEMIAMIYLKENRQPSSSLPLTLGRPRVSSPARCF